MEYSIISAQEKDAEAICSLGNTVQEFETSDETVTFWPLETLRKIIQSRTDDILIAVSKEDKSIVGFAIYAHNDTFQKTTLENLYVTPENRRLGVGAALISAVKQAVKKIGSQYVMLLSQSENKGGGDFFESQGFEKGDTFTWMDMTLTDDYKKE